jgi:hypothetical protein
LYSIVYSDYYWRPRKVSQAVCNGRGVGHVGDAVPVENCGCGFYSAKSLEHLFSMHYRYYDVEANGVFVIVGKVANWGKVIEGDLGWRAQKAYPLEFLVPFEAWKFAKKLKEAYGVPVRLKNFLKDFKDLDPEDQLV